MTPSAGHKKTWRDSWQGFLLGMTIVIVVTILVPALAFLAAWRLWGLEAGCIAVIAVCCTMVALTPAGSKP